MCCLFGVIDIHHTLSRRQKNRLISTLSVAAEVRGTDATGIAYNSNGRLRIYKEPIPARFMHYNIPEDAGVIIGHTRMATQGSAMKNRNNHPFSGMAGNEPFALAHNGVLYNDETLQKSLNLPHTKIETDSYVAVQLLERSRSLSTESLREMAEQVHGSFSFTILDGHDTLHIVKGDNPLCIYHYPRMGLFLYASTEEILNTGIRRAGFLKECPEKISLSCGDILHIDNKGYLTKGTFNASHLHSSICYYSPYDIYTTPAAKKSSSGYIEELKSVAAVFGYTGEMIDRLLRQGFSPEEVEEWLYCCGT